LKFGSVCSGIEAASVAFEPLGFTAQWFSEIEHFPSEVLKYRYPTVPNLGDMTKLTENETFRASSIDLLVGGTPCQSFSVAGLRRGLADPRGNLMLTFLALADAKKPRWIVWENVPGVLSSNGGKDFGTFLGALGELGYGFAYRVLDAQHFGVAQRRRRVFVVGYLGDWRPAAAVLFERESLSRDSKPSRKKGQETPTDAQGSVGEAGDAEPIAFDTFNQTTSNVNQTIKSPQGGVNESIGVVAQPFRKVRRAQSDSDFETWEKDETANTLNCFDVGDVRSTNVVAQPIVLEDQGGSVINASDKGIVGTLRAQTHGHEPAVLQPIAFKVRGGCEGGGKGYLGQEEQAFTISTMQDQQIAQPIAVDIYNPPMAIRRLTTKECERLQGFPDDWTKIPYRNKPADQCPDGPRYKACGNSMAVPVMRWIGQRIQLIDTIIN
jgi:DNA (cytosine-5)-methyltransferase 1